MLFTTHLAAGLALGRWIRHPVAACVAGVLSHLALDRTPHWDGYDASVPWTARRNLAAIARDLAATGAIISLAVSRRWIRQDRPGVLWGALGAVAPDLLWVPYHVLGARHPRWFFDLHGRIQRSARWQPSLLAQLAVIGLSLWQADRDPDRG